MTINLQLLGEKIRRYPRIYSKNTRITKAFTIDNATLVNAYLNVTKSLDSLGNGDPLLLSEPRGSLTFERFWWHRMRCTKHVLCALLQSFDVVALGWWRFSTGKSR